MPKIKLTVGGRSYEIACGEGQEARVQRMGEVVEGILAKMPSSAQAGDSQRLFLAALSLADDYEEAQQQQAALEEKLAAFERRIEQMQRLSQAAARESEKQESALDAELAGAVEKAVREIEALAAGLASPAPGWTEA